MDEETSPLTLLQIKLLVDQVGSLDKEGHSIWGLNSSDSANFKVKDFHATKVIEYMIVNMRTKCYDDDIMIEQLFYVFKMINTYCGLC